jgi:hypothetical protein
MGVYGKYYIIFISIFNKKRMDLLVLILILLSGYIIKYLIDTINSLNNEIREIKMKCISTQNNVKFDNNSNTTSTDAEKAAKAANDAKATLIKNITYFKDYFDTE